LILFLENYLVSIILCGSCIGPLQKDFLTKLSSLRGEGSVGWPLVRGEMVSVTFIGTCGFFLGIMPLWKF